MKKIQIFYVLLLAVLTVAFTSCKSCAADDSGPTAAELLKLGSNRVISTHRQAVYLNTPKDYVLKWMQSEAVWTAFLTDDYAADATLMEVTNGFQSQCEIDIDGHKAIDTKVTVITTNTMATDSLVMKTFYLDNYPLNDKPIILSFEDARLRALNANCPKPQTRVAVLRSPVGPVSVSDAYYIFGNEDGDVPMVFVNARTGEVTTYNPAWGKPKTPSEPQ